MFLSVRKGPAKLRSPVPKTSVVSVICLSFIQWAAVNTKLDWITLPPQMWTKLWPFLTWILTIHGHWNYGKSPIILLNACTCLYQYITILILFVASWAETCPTSMPFIDLVDFPQVSKWYEKLCLTIFYFQYVSVKYIPWPKAKDEISIVTNKALIVKLIHWT